MKIALSGLVCCALVLAVPARAAPQAAAPAGTPVPQKQMDKAIAGQQGEIKRLQGDVEREESRTHQADEKLKQQDRQIADLQRQLEAMRARQGNGHP